MRIPRVLEPKDIKYSFQRDLATNYEVAVAVIKQGTWFTKEYYNRFKRELNSQGIKWQDLMEAYGRVNYVFVRWARGECTWDEALNALEKSLNDIVRYRSR